VGQERECTLRFGGKDARGKALLETEEIIFRGEPRRVFKLAALKDVRAEDGRLAFVVDGVAASLDLGDDAVKWAAKIASPKGRLDKLGVKPGAAVTLAGRFDDDFVAELAALPCAVTKRAAAGSALILLAAEVAADLAPIETLRAKLADDGALWIVYPKGKTVIREADVLGAGRAAKMTDHKVAKFSETHTALKFVIPPAMRKSGPAKPKSAKSR
jgi:hypothetical protein